MRRFRFKNDKMTFVFTCIDDTVDGIVRLLDKLPKRNPDFNSEHPNSGVSYAPYEIFNIGNNQPLKSMDFIQTIEKPLRIEAKREFLPM